MKKGIEINVKILQFGNTQIEISRDEEIIEEISRQPIIYGEPTKTNYQAIEICFDEKEYRVPKTTGGIF